MAEKTSLELAAGLFRNTDKNEGSNKPYFRLMKRTDGASAPTVED